MQGRPFVLLGVNADHDSATALAAANKLGVPGRSWWDGAAVPGPIAARWGITAWPTIFLIDAHGVVRYQQLFGADLDQAVECLVREAEAGHS
jgi:hypothetical protein